MDPFQVTVLSDQVESQTEKITDLERVLDDKQGTLQKTEDVLARELLEKSALETARLGLLSEITDMRLRQVNQFSITWITWILVDCHRTRKPGT